MRSGTHVHVHAGKKRSRITELPERLSRIGVQTDDHFVVAAAVHRVQALTAAVDQNARMAKSNIALPQALRHPGPSTKRPVRRREPGSCAWALPIAASRPRPATAQPESNTMPGSNR